MGFIDSLRKQGEAKLILRHPRAANTQVEGRERRGRWLFSNPAAIQVWTNDPSEGHGYKLLKQMQSSDDCKELVSLANKKKKITKRQCFPKNKSVQLTCEKGGKMPEAGEGGR